MHCVIMLILAVLPFVQGGCSDKTDCASCVDSTYFFVKCRWCEMTNTCHAKGSVYNRCKSCDKSDTSYLCCSITEANKCNSVNLNSGESGDFEPVDASNAALYSAVAYSDDPTSCAQKILPGTVTIVDEIGRKCDNYLFDYEHCFAFTAISHPLEKIILAYRGTSSTNQLIDEVLTVLGKPKVPAKGEGNVQEYFRNANDQLYPCVKSSVKRLINLYPSYTVVITGHSLGGTVASIASAQLSFDNVINKTKTTLYTFGMPRTGDCFYAENHDKLVPKSWRVVHFKDIVAGLPIMTKSSGPFHHNREIFYGKKMSVKSDYTKCSKYEDPICRNSVSSSLTYEDHIMYYGISVGSYCDKMVGKRRKRSDADSDMSRLFTSEQCRIIRVSDMPTSGAAIYVQTMMNITSVLVFYVAPRLV